MTAQRRGAHAAGDGDTLEIALTAQDSLNASGKMIGITRSAQPHRPGHGGRKNLA